MEENAYNKSINLTLIYLAVGLGGGVVPFIWKLFCSDPMLFGLVFSWLFIIVLFIFTYAERNS